MAVGHAHFEAVHPFSDGNGRIGRMLWALQMVAADRLPLYLSSYVEARRIEYGEALQAASDGINRLEKAGVVRERSGHGRRRIYAAEEVISVLARPFGADTDVVLESARNVLQMPD